MLNKSWHDNDVNSFQNDRNYREQNSSWNRIKMWVLISGMEFRTRWWMWSQECWSLLFRIRILWSFWPPLQMWRLHRFSNQKSKYIIVIYVTFASRYIVFFSWKLSISISISNFFMSVVPLLYRIMYLYYRNTRNENASKHYKIQNSSERCQMWVPLSCMGWRTCCWMWSQEWGSLLFPKGILWRYWCPLQMWTLCRFSISEF